MAIGAFLPWVTVKLNFGSLNLTGTPIGGSNISRSMAGVKAGEGKIVLVCALVAIGLGIAAMFVNGKLGFLAGVPGLIAVIVVLKVFGDKAKYDHDVPSLGSGSAVHVSLSVGIYVTLVMAFAVIALGVVCGLASRSK